MPSANHHHPPLVVVLGPTAVGKTELALNLAERLEGEVVSADSRLFYRGMDVGTAKPLPEERSRVPHHLIDVADPDNRWSLAVFQQAAFEAIDDIHGRGRLPIMAGGTGQYVRSITEGWQIPRQEPDPRIRSTLRSWATEIGRHGLHRRLVSLDPVAAEAIDPRNLRRTVRALEVIFHTGRKFSEQRTRREPRYRVCQLGLSRPREVLYARIDRRIERMLAEGWLEEVQRLLDAGFDPDLPAFSAIGYRELAAHLRDEIDLAEAVRLIKRRTRQFVRRQANWFKPDDPKIRWIHVQKGGDVPTVEQAVELAVEIVRSFLKT